MNLEILGISVLWTFLFGYILVGAIDFGAGFFNAYSLLTGKKRILTNVIQRYLSPVWEVTNVFLVFFFVGIIGFFPKTAFYYGTTLLVPVSIGIILLAIRGSYYAFETYGTRGHKGYSFMYGLSGLLLPASLSIVLTISEGGFVEMVNGNPVLDYWKLFMSPLTWSIVLLSIAATLYISATFLTWYANKAQDVEATNLLRKYALIWALPTIITASGIIFELRIHNPAHYNNIQNFWLMFLISFLMFIGTVWLLWKRRNLRAGIYPPCRPIRLCLFWLRRVALPVFALSILNDLRQLHEPGYGNFINCRIYYGSWTSHSVSLFIDAFVLV